MPREPVVFYELWWAPTLLGQKVFGWRHRLKRVYQVTNADELEAARDACYLYDIDSASPDHHDYEQYVLIGPLPG